MADPIPSLPAVDPEERIVTMPERFRGAAAAFVPGKEAMATPAPSERQRVDGTARTARPPVWLFALVGILLVAGIGFGAWWFLTPRAAFTPAPVANANANRPANVNRRTNQNQNANRNVNVPAPATTTPAAATTTPAATSLSVNANTNSNVNAPAPSGPVRLAADADADGLTDAEESEIYKADPARPDSDGDGFLDGVEVFNLYSPTGATRERLADGNNVLTATEATGFSVLSPALWRRQVIDPQTGAVAWLAPTGEFVQAMVQDNPQNLPIADWYLAQSPGVQRSQLAPFTTPSRLSGVRSPDGFTSYVALAPQRVLVVSYTLGARSEASYRRTYEMMTNSLQAVAMQTSTTSTPPTASTPTSTP